MEINDYVLKLTGSASLPEPLEIDKDYLISCEGSITGSADDSLENGTITRTFKFRPRTIEILKDNGQTMKTTAGKSWSKKLRGALWYLARDKGWDDEETYERFMKKLLAKVVDEPDKVIEFLND